MKRQLQFLRITATAAMTGIAILVPLAAQAAIAPGTQLSGTLDQQLDSRSARVGERFTISKVHSQNNNVHDATIYGHVASVVHPGQGRNAEIGLAFDKLRTLSGSSYALDARAVNTQVNTRSNALKEAGGAVGGMVVGNILGKALGTNAGGAVGAAGGFLYAKNSRENVTLPTGALITIAIDQATYKGRNAY